MRSFEDTARLAKWLIETEYPDTSRELEVAEEEAWRFIGFHHGISPRQLFKMAWIAGVYVTAVDPELAKKAYTLDRFLRDRLEQ